MPKAKSGGKVPCPKCANARALPIVYGYPGSEMERSADRGEIVLGGSSIRDDSPSWQCAACGHRWSDAIHSSTSRGSGEESIGGRRKPRGGILG